MHLLPQFYTALDVADDRVQYLTAEIADLIMKNGDNLEIEAKLGFFQVGHRTENPMVNELMDKLLDVKAMTILPEAKRQIGGGSSYVFSSGLEVNGDRPL